VRKCPKNLSQDIQSPGRDLNPVTPEYKAGVLTTRPRRSVGRFCAATYVFLTSHACYVSSIPYPLCH
jgi:hypothetical protein